MSRVWAAPSFHATFVLIVGIFLISSDGRVPHSKYHMHSHPRPHSSAIAKQFTEPDGNGRGNRFALVKDVVEMLARDPKQGGDLAPGLASRRDHILTQQFAWVSSGTGSDRAWLHIGHSIAPQMILLARRAQ